MKRTIALLSIILVLAAGWTATWHYIAGEVERKVNEGQARLVGQGVETTCGNRTISGYPFRLSLNCNDVGYANSNSGFGVKSGALKTAAQAYQPGKLVMELTGPAQLFLQQREIVKLDWGSLRSSLTANLDGPQKISMQGKAVNIQSQDPELAATELSEIQFHSRLANENDLDVVLDARKVISLENRWVPFDFLVDMQLSGVYRALLERPDVVHLAKSSGLKGTINGVHYVLETDGKLSIFGPFELSRTGLLSGQFQLKLRNVEQLIAALKVALPQQADVWQQVGSAVALLGKAGQSGDIEIGLTVKDGNARLGLIPLGKIRPFWSQ